MDGRLATSLGWFFGCSLILVGFWLTGFYFLTGAALALLGFLWWPPSRSWIIQRLGLPRMPVLHAALTLCLLVVALFAFIGRYSAELEARALEAGYPGIEAWRDAQRETQRQP
ncbi:hypothetical protein [Marinospirillum alkaliphilum]|uniref:Uncharacterized protein n=1 Tax=Marinospirillum alkaliphilum DSM 21637 TaxID=1122209 RepID=A0A1K1XKE5_9GAMM|nr:hypothetical protein [Marinospirillum alkaliphilum]SFX50194.1 hypothetical protein SAMN02745752_01893 [Marinospirillum alkaliphilum DSM 21637]